MNSKQKAQLKFKKLHPEAGALTAKRYRQNNKEKVKETGKKYRKRYYTNPTYKLTVLNRSRISSALKGKIKADSTITMLGCTIEEFKIHIEKQFLKGMNWSNRGEWHVDHILPCSKFDLTDARQQKICFHYTNLQPLWARDNIKKSNKI